MHPLDAVNYTRNENAMRTLEVLIYRRFKRVKDGTGWRAMMRLRARPTVQGHLLQLANVYDEILDYGRPAERVFEAGLP